MLKSPSSPRLELDVAIIIGDEISDSAGDMVFGQSELHLFNMPTSIALGLHTMSRKKSFMRMK